MLHANQEHIKMIWEPVSYVDKPAYNVQIMFLVQPIKEDEQWLEIKLFNVEKVAKNVALKIYKLVYSVKISLY